MPSVAKYKFESNALYMQECLNSNNIPSEIEKSGSDLDEQFDLIVAEADCINATRILERTLLDESEVPIESDGHVENYVLEQSGPFVPFDDVERGFIKTGLQIKGKVSWKYIGAMTFVWYIIFSIVALILIPIVFFLIISLLRLIRHVTLL